MNVIASSRTIDFEAKMWVPLLALQTTLSLLHLTLPLTIKKKNPTETYIEFPSTYCKIEAIVHSHM